MEKNDIKKIVLTGGPCAGKTTALVRIFEHFTNMGYKVFAVPEIPTLVTQSGWNYLTDNHDFYFEGELIILELQLAMEDKIMRMAQTIKDKPCIVICDRGTMDISAYISPEMWETLVARVGSTTAELMNRYDAVLHLVSAADGAEEFYTTATNAQRYEQADEAGLAIARSLDKKVINAWKNHPRLSVINNGEDFERKMQAVLKEISNVMGIPQQEEENRKYIVAVVDEMPECIESEITQTYLCSEPDSEVRLRRRGWEGKFVNIHTTKKKISDTEVTITERQVSNALYETLLEQADSKRQTVVKNRKSFIWKGQFFELDSYVKPMNGLLILETKGMARHEDIKFPPFLKVVEDITGNKKYYNHNIALRK